MQKIASLTSTVAGAVCVSAMSYRKEVFMMGVWKGTLKGSKDYRWESLRLRGKCGVSKFQIGGSASYLRGAWMMALFRRLPRSICRLTNVLTLL